MVDEDIWISIEVLLDPNNDSGNKCYGSIVFEANSMLWSEIIKFNGKTNFAGIYLWGSSHIFTNTTKDKIGTLIEDLAKDFITDYNLDNK